MPPVPDSISLLIIIRRDDWLCCPAHRLLVLLSFWADFSSLSLLFYFY